MREMGQEGFPEQGVKRDVGLLNVLLSFFCSTGEIREVSCDYFPGWLFSSLSVFEITNPSLVLSVLQELLDLQGLK